jgi:hypothetical protein
MRSVQPPSYPRPTPVRPRPAYLVRLTLDGLDAWTSNLVLGGLGDYLRDSILAACWEPRIILTARLTPRAALRRRNTFTRGYRAGAAACEPTCPPREGPNPRRQSDPASLLPAGKAPKCPPGRTTDDQPAHVDGSAPSGAAPMINVLTSTEAIMRCHSGATLKFYRRTKLAPATAIGDVTQIVKPAPQIVDDAPETAEISEGATR